ncbi:TnsA-like heteromeric transposase endonuclease subunit [Streptomyces sp. NPDC102340]|uniref:TnsA-like heteromeric transposase endonuclease subunit n=1 Tax=unclassified Streptomyces TaxID=2593676 RepID=UPI0037F71551
MVSGVVWGQFRSRSGRVRELPVRELREERLEERAGVWEPKRHRGRRAIATWWRPADRVGHAGCATLGALEAAVSLEFDPEVVTFSSWPVRLRWADDASGYVPDFFARLGDGRARLLVRRPNASGPATGRWHRTLALLEAAGEQTGWQVRVHTGDEDPVVVRNRQRLARYRHDRFADADIARALSRAFAEPRCFDAGVAASGMPRLVAVACGLHLIWRGELLFDWSRPFVPGRSVVWSRPQAAA